jgi:hypothetical protein
MKRAVDAKKQEPAVQKQLLSEDQIPF